LRRRISFLPCPERKQQRRAARQRGQSTFDSPASLPNRPRETSPQIFPAPPRQPRKGRQRLGRSVRAGKGITKRSPSAGGATRRRNPASVDRLPTKSPCPQASLCVLCVKSLPLAKSRTLKSYFYEYKSSAKSVSVSRGRSLASMRTRYGNWHSSTVRAGDELRRRRDTCIKTSPF
jgi:hypothetical protein